MIESEIVRDVILKMSPIENQGRLSGSSLDTGGIPNLLVEQITRGALIRAVMGEKRAGRWQKATGATKPISVGIPDRPFGNNVVTVVPSLIRDTGVYSTSEPECCKLIDIAPWTDLFTFGREECIDWAQTLALLGIKYADFDRKVRTLTMETKGGKIVLDTGPESWGLAASLADPEDCFLFAQELRRVIAGHLVFDTESVIEISQRGLLWIDAKESLRRIKAFALPFKLIAAELPGIEAKLFGESRNFDGRLLVLPTSLPCSGHTIVKDRQIWCDVYRMLIDRRPDLFVFVDK